MELFFHLIMVKKAAADDNEDMGVGPSTATPVPKFYLKPINIIPLDTFAATHGPFTSIQEGN